MHALAFALGAFLIVGLGFGKGAALLCGVAAGFLSWIKLVFQEPVLPTVINPANPPSSLRGGRQPVWIFVTAFIGLLPIAMALWAPTPREWLRPFSMYVGGMALGTTVALLISAKRTREAYDRWLEARSPLSNLDIDQ